MWETIFSTSCFVLFFPCSIYSWRGRAGCQPCDFRGFCPSWDHGAQGSVPLDSLLSVSRVQIPVHSAHHSSSDPLQPSLRQGTLVQLMSGVRPQRFPGLSPSRHPLDTCLSATPAISGCSSGWWYCPPALQSHPMEGSCSRAHCVPGCGGCHTHFRI